MQMVLTKLFAVALGVIFIAAALAWETSECGQAMAEEYGGPAQSCIGMMIVGLLCLTAAGM